MKIEDFTVYTMEIVDKEGTFYQIIVKSEGESCKIAFSIELKELKFLENNKLTKQLLNNRYQLRKILHNKRPDTFYIGFKLKFIFKKNKDAIAFNDLSKLVVLDRRKGLYDVKSIQKHNQPILELFTDGCYLVKQKQGAFAVVFKNTDGKLNLFTKKVDVQSSSLIELIAVIEGIKRIKGEERLRVISDSRYVIKGLTEWMFNWKLNDWHTAQGEKVRNIAFWQEFDVLTRNKYLEFEWVKGHSFHQENTLADKYAKEAAFRELRT